jgi:hypothetical protein
MSCRTDNYRRAVDPPHDSNKHLNIRRIYVSIGMFTWLFRDVRFILSFQLIRVSDKLVNISQSLNVTEGCYVETSVLTTIPYSGTCIDDARKEINS